MLVATDAAVAKRQVQSDPATCKARYRTKASWKFIVEFAHQLRNLACTADCEHQTLCAQQPRVLVLVGDPTWNGATYLL
jgi:hypothetical protein